MKHNIIPILIILCLYSCNNIEQAVEKPENTSASTTKASDSSLNEISTLTEIKEVSLPLNLVVNNATELSGNNEPSQFPTWIAQNIAWPEEKAHPDGFSLTDGAACEIIGKISLSKDIIALVLLYRGNDNSMLGGYFISTFYVLQTFDISQEKAIDSLFLAQSYELKDEEISETMASVATINKDLSIQVSTTKDMQDEGDLELNEAGGQEREESTKNHQIAPDGTFKDTTS